MKIVPPLGRRSLRQARRRAGNTHWWARRSIEPVKKKESGFRFFLSLDFSDSASQNFSGRSQGFHRLFLLSPAL
jgi:hypothetical protein